MKLVITGASGAIGQALLERFVQLDAGKRDACQIHALTSSNVGKAMLVERFPKVQVTQHLAWQGIRNALNGADVLVHLAWNSVPATAALDPKSDLVSNVYRTEGLLDEAAACGVGKILFLSSGGTVYGPMRTNGPISEDHPLVPSSAYGVSKLAFEQLLQSHAKAKGYVALVLRPSNVYGMPIVHARPQGVVHHWMKAVLEDRPIALWNEGTTVRDLLHIDDMLDAILLAIGFQSHSATFNVGTGVGTSLAELVRAFEVLVDRPIRIEERVNAVEAVDRNVLSTALIKAAIGFEAKVPLAEGLKRVWQEMKRSG